MKNHVVHIWCDGSYRQAHNIAGAGWLIQWPDNNRAEHSLCLPEQKDTFNYGSERAELLAAAHAIRTVADKLNGQKVEVVVHMDNRSAFESLKSGSMTIKKPGEALISAFEEALRQIARLSSVTFEWASDKSNSNMELVNNLARKASTPGKKSGKAPQP